MTNLQSSDSCKHYQDAQQQWQKNEHDIYFLRSALKRTLCNLLVVIFTGGSSKGMITITEICRDAATFTSQPEIAPKGPIFRTVREAESNLQKLLPKKREHQVILASQHLIK